MAEGDAINEYCVVYGWNTNVTQQIRSPAESIFMWLLERLLSGADPDEFGQPASCFKSCISQQELFSDQHVLFETRSIPKSWLEKISASVFSLRDAIMNKLASSKLR